MDSCKFYIGLLILTLLLTTMCKCGRQHFRRHHSQQNWTSPKYVIADLTRCRAVSPDVLIWVQGRATSPHLRAMIRETIGNQKLWPHNLKVMIAFFTGRLSTDDAKYQLLLEYEFEMYRDIIQTDFTEMYKTQVHKTISGINYISEHCFNLKLVVKMDDDVVFHPELLVPELTSIMAYQTTVDHTISLDSIPTGTLVCNLHEEAEIIRKRQHYRDTWAVEDDVLPDRVVYPPFCAGFFVAMSGDVPRLLQPHIATNEPFWMEDRYMGVLQECARTLSVDIHSMLDYGYHDITEDNMTAMTNMQVLAQHLPTNLELHISQIFDYLSSGVDQKFETIIWIKFNKRQKSYENWLKRFKKERTDQYFLTLHEQQQKRYAMRGHNAEQNHHLNGVRIAKRMENVKRLHQRSRQLRERVELARRLVYKARRPRKSH